MRQPHVSGILKAGMPVKGDAESRAIDRLIAEIDAIDKWRDRVGRRIVAMFFGVFLAAVSLLFYAATHAQQRVDPPPDAGPRHPGVLRSYR